MVSCKSSRICCHNYYNDKIPDAIRPSKLFRIFASWVPSLGIFYECAFRFQRRHIASSGIAEKSVFSKGGLAAFSSGIKPDTLSPGTFSVLRIFNYLHSFHPRWHRSASINSLAPRADTHAVRSYCWANIFHLHV